MTTLTQANLEELKPEDLVVLAGQVGMVINTTNRHPQVMFLENGVCCSLVAEPINLISEADRHKYQDGDYAEGYVSALKAVVH